MGSEVSSSEMSGLVSHGENVIISTGKLCGAVKEDRLWTVLVVVYLTKRGRIGNRDHIRTCTEDGSVSFVKDEDSLCVVRWEKLH